MKLSIEEANNQYKDTVNSLLAKYGSATHIPNEEWREASETLRLHCTIASNDGQVTKELLARNMFSEAIIAKVNPDFEGFQPKVKRSAKYDSAYEWLDENAEETFTTQQIADALEMSYPTTLKFIENNPHYFRKVKRGEYQIRNPKAEREAEK
jgi:hypothetical protein